MRTPSFRAGSRIKIKYAPHTAPEHERGLPQSITSGEDVGGITSTITYPDKYTIVETDPRGVKTTTTLDAWRRPVHVSVSGDVPVDEIYEYDANGRLHETRRKQGITTVKTTYEYDILGRMTKTTMDGIAVAGAPTTLISTTSYDLPNHTITSTSPKGSVTTMTIDTLGRTVRSTTTTGSAPIEGEVAYDIDDNVVFTTDKQTASAAAFDIHGRLSASLGFDGTRSETQFDDWGRPRVMKSLDANGIVTGESRLDLTAAGKLKSIATDIEAGKTNSMNLGWDGGGRTSLVASQNRASHSKFDTASRTIGSEAGEGSLAGLTDVFSSSRTLGHSGALATSAISVEKGTAGYQLGFDYDDTGNPILQKVGSLEWTQKYDEAGNVITAAQPNRREWKAEYDARGALTKETLPDGAVLSHAYDALGAPTGYTDPSNETTETTTDLIGRPRLRTYRDGTTETWTYDSTRLTSHKDRQNRLRTLIYNAKGQVWRITGSNNTLLEEIEYDDAGRVKRRTNKDASIEYGDYNLAGLPRMTRQTRFKDGTGLGGQQVLDRYEQTHSWNEHAERAGFTMPSYAGLTLSAGWTSQLALGYDAMGNLATMTRDGSPFMTGEFRNAGRPDVRTLTPSCAGVAGACTPGSIARQYGYHPQTGQMNLMRVLANGQEAAGSAITFDGLQRAEAQLLGLSDGARSNRWEYDDRSRLSTSVSAKLELAQSSVEVMTPSDFRSELQRPEGGAAALPSISFTEKAGGGHKIETITKGSSERVIAWDGSELVDDGTFAFDFDTYGRLVRVTEKVTAGASSLSVRRIHYSYSPSNRLVGRRAEYAQLPSVGTPPLDSDWKLEDRGDVLSSDALPAEVTFVWDPLSDTIVSAFKAGASEAGPGQPNGGLLRQILHGGMSYDDPVEVTVADSNAASGAVTHLYPIYDEAGAGMLQAVLNANGEVVSRNFADGPYGEDEYVMTGPGVESVSVTAAKNATGTLERVDVRIRLTERIAEATLQTGVRLAALDASGVVLRSTQATARLLDTYTAGWTLTPDEWNALLGSGDTRAVSLSIAATSTLRADGWGDDAAVLPAPGWAIETKPVFSTAEFPVDVRESVTSLETWLVGTSAGTEATQTLYEVRDLAAMTGSSSSTAGHPERLLVAGSFHAHPFSEPLTGKNYVRNRWFDPNTGTWLTPDPLGYQDSSNLYAFCGGDPVNCSDPTGTEGFWGDAGRTLWGYTKGVGQVVASPGLLTYNLTGALLYETTGGQQYHEQFRNSQQIGAALAYAAQSPTNAANLLVEGVTAGVDQMVECANRGDAGCTGEGLGNLVAQTLMIAQTAGTTSATTTPVQAFATSTGAVVRTGSGVALITSPNAPLVASILLSSAVNGAGKSGGAEPVRIGQAGEQVGSEVSGLPKNTRRVPSASGRRAYRIPDHMDPVTERFIQEDKATKKQYLSSQLLDDKAHVLRDSGPGTVHVLIDETTEITLPLLREHLNQGSPIKLQTGTLRKP